MTANRRASARRMIEPLVVSTVSSIESHTKLFRGGEIIEASTSGFLLTVARDALVPMSLRKNLTIDSLVGTRVVIHLPQMNIEVSGVVTRTKLLGKKGYEVGVDYSDDAPDYWRECLLDLLPAPGEFDQDH